MEHKKSFYLALAVSCLLCAGAARGADEPAGKGNPCTDDIARFCKDVKPGMPALMDCLESHESELTPACRKYESGMLGGRVETKERIRAMVRFRQPCRDDIDKFCKGVKGYEEVRKCLISRSDRLSAACREALK